jgi:Fe-S-cluster containining protein
VSTEDHNSEWYAPGLRFTCGRCGNCCTGPEGYVWFSDDEARAMAAALGLSIEQFLQLHTRETHQGRRSLREVESPAGRDCVFLRRDHEGRALCSVYHARPTQCRTWPFWPENLRSSAAWARAARSCQGMTQGLAGQGELYPIERVRLLRAQQVSHDRQA